MASTAPGLVITPPPERPAVLLAVAHAVAVHADLAALLRDLAGAVQGHMRADYLSFSLVEPGGQTARLQLLQPIGPSLPPQPGDTPTQLVLREAPVVEDRTELLDEVVVDLLAQLVQHRVAPTRRGRGLDLVQPLVQRHP